jgi:hypothetical protein
VLCPACGARKGRRTCPALGEQICSVCCGTKRLTEIRCPSDCAYLAVAREHPAAALLRRQEQDVEAFVRFLRDLNERQSQLFLLIGAFLARYEPPALQRVIDVDVAEAAAALASTFETAARGLIYDHRPASRPAERLTGELKALLAEAGSQGGSAFERDAAVVLRRIEEAARASRESQPASESAFLELLARVIQDPPNRQAASAATAEQSRLILP